MRKDEYSPRGPDRVPPDAREHQFLLFGVVRTSRGKSRVYFMYARKSWAPEAYKNRKRRIRVSFHDFILSMLLSGAFLKMVIRLVELLFG